MSIKKFISIGLITCMGVGICYNNTYALDDSFLKFLINDFLCILQGPFSFITDI